MKVLFVAPQPFFTNRGTPIAVKTITETLGSLGHKVDLLTYHLGESPEIKNVTIHRIPDLPIRKIGTGFSIQKLLLDIPLSLKFLRMALSGGYDIVHCVEESIFTALSTRFLHHKACVFDIDSSMPDQLVQKGGSRKLLRPFFECAESWAIKRSLCCITVCTALSENVAKVAPDKKVFQIEDIPLVPDRPLTESEAASIRHDLGVGKGKMCAYVGNFSRYQGIGLMFEAFRIVKSKMNNVSLVVIGGSHAEVEEQKAKAKELGIIDNMVFTGMKPPDESARILQAADALLSPRSQGTNTPMKLYTYMASGVPIVATNLPTHTQVLDDNSAVLVRPGPQDMAEGIIQLLDNDEFGQRLAVNAEKIVEDKYSKEKYIEKVRKAYSWIETQIA